MSNKQAKCPKCNTVLREREQFCRECNESVERKDKEHQQISTVG
tara:strand:- start:3463 stop:3594 length:132 start_codon:yes stop_codon:yes gene_type:complete